MVNALLLVALVSNQAEAPPLQSFAPLVGTWKGKVSGMFGEGESTRVYKWSPSKSFLNYETTTIFTESKDEHKEFGHISWDATAKKAVLREFFEMGVVFKYVQSGDWGFKSTEIENNPMGGATARYEWALSGGSFTEKLYLTSDGKEELSVTTVYKRS